MDQGFLTMAPEGTSLARKAWTAYIHAAVLAALAFGVMVPLAWRFSWLAAMGIAAVTLLFISYRVAMVRSTHLFYDDVGVWVFSGVFPWNRGVSGVKWRDVDEALFFPTFWSWASRSYSVRIAHRFTQSSEVFLDHIARGNDAVAAINSMHQQMVRQGLLG